MLILFKHYYERFPLRKGNLLCNSLTWVWTDTTPLVVCTVEGEIPRSASASFRLHIAHTHIWHSRGRERSEHTLQSGGPCISHTALGRGRYRCGVAELDWMAVALSTASLVHRRVSMPWWLLLWDWNQAPGLSFSQLASHLLHWRIHLHWLHQLNNNNYYYYHNFKSPPATPHSLPSSLSPGPPLDLPENLKFILNHNCSTHK